MIRYGFFNSINGDRKYNADDMTKYFDKIVSDGVFHDQASALKVTSSLSEGFTIDVHRGRGLIDCRWIENDTIYTITLDPSDMLLDRIDTVVMRLDLRESERKMEIAVVKGVPAVTPVPHQRVKTADIKELILGYVRVNHNAITISDSDITDTRADESVCGWVHSLVSTGNIKKYQYHARLEEETDYIVPELPEHTTSCALNVYINGMLLAEGIEYTTEGAGESLQINFAHKIAEGNTVTCVVLKVE